MQKIKFPSVTIAIVRSREEYFDEAFFSAENQLYANEVELIVIDNKDLKKSIGKCYNRVVEKSTKEWILFLGDDDYICPEYVLSLMARMLMFRQKLVEEKKKGEVVCVSSFVTLFDEKNNICFDKMPQGMWLRSYLQTHKFDEKLRKHVDTAMYQVAEADPNAHIGLVAWNFGYFYRQHGDNISGNKIERLNDDTEIIRIKEKDA